MAGIETFIDKRLVIEKDTKKNNRQITFADLYSKSKRGELGSQRFYEAPDFGIKDPWSQFMRSTIDKVRDQGGFTGDLFEAGVGAGPNVITAIGAHRSGEIGKVGNITGVDVDGWRLDLARRNFETAGIPSEKYKFHEGGVVDYLLKRPYEQKITGWGIACLPQAPMGETVNHADGADPKVDSLDIVNGMTLEGRHVDTYGLKLNAAFLSALNPQVDEENFNLLIILSDRVPPDVRKELFKSTGWGIRAEYKTDHPVKQDPDTGISYVARYDDGRRFYQKRIEGFEPIYAGEAEVRRVDSLGNGERKDLNVYHHLSVYHVSPEVNSKDRIKGGVIYER